MTDTKPDSQILDSLDWTPGCETTDCDNTATCAEITTCCGESLARCDECRDRSERWGREWRRITCRHCRTKGRYADLIEWRSL